MNVAKNSIAHLSLVGAWRPKSMNSKFLKQFYAVYGGFILTLLISFAVYVLIYCLKFSKDVNSFTHSLLEFITILLGIIKMLQFKFRQDEIISIDKMLSENICLPRDEKECLILKESENFNRKRANVLKIGCYLSCMYLYLIPLMSSDKLALPFPNVWIPLNFESKIYYRFIYLYQVIASFFSTVIICECDIYITHFIEKICSQLEVFQYRLYILPREMNNNFKLEKRQYELCVIKDWLQFHLHFIKMVNNLNNTFNLIVFVQFFISTCSLGIIIFHFTKVKLFTTHFWYICVYLFNFTAEIFLFCFYGEKLIAKSTQIVNSFYNVNWNTLSKSSRMSLFIMMMRASKPMKIVGGSFITLSTHTFVVILKTAYSIFNVLR